VASTRRATFTGPPLRGKAQPSQGATFTASARRDA
jgi:hypothetical protein